MICFLEMKVEWICVGLTVICNTLFCVGCKVLCVLHLILGLDCTAGKFWWSSWLGGLASFFSLFSLFIFHGGGNISFYLPYIVTFLIFSHICIWIWLFYCIFLYSIMFLFSLIKSQLCIMWKLGFIESW